ncbi:hypothetical protein NDN11_13665 [Acinetobacter sp. C26M]|uniref:hypothetical protein n=1 Tax=unclassified Acinetobacter TaxID=196816 RepID=UPI0020371B54|nr:MULTISPECIES: hypothetical protein [unclassified Acinetobacter]USA45750.1 hypothetical protein NDN11_13665 [Acinetobacter sp. C26M]USA49249.1 hypothetical protein NDN12_13665 [Acinetobacter sp. C26G]
MNVERHVYTDEEFVELRTAHMLAKSILGHSYPQNVIEAAEKRTEEDFERMVRGEVTHAEVEAELLQQWNAKVALKIRIGKLEQELQQGQEILNNWKDKEQLMFERHKSCVEGQRLRLDEMRKALIRLG